MKAVLQRVASASVTVDSNLVSSIGKGVLVFAAVAKDDTRKEVESMAAKVLKLKMWPDETGGTWKQNVQDINGEVLCVSQFTLLASTKKGNKPDFHGAAGGEEARELYDHFFAKVQELYEPGKVKNGVFQAMMEVNIQNSGPVGLDYTSHDEVVTLEIDTNPRNGQDANTKPGDGKGEHQQSKASADKEKRQVAESFQLPVELLD
ncbi:D-tyrosyl-tRNA(Tyr) deacylase [Imshaugia aleurites]|uniref:D-aminoacyl-tRNA deacylase n=1 Tax=Imshaugia aleurites TaxID=172621 RepID=A0A8H3G9I6_9LECA|nr:D-tyrosyl-tRNA(Tyr) deacylase [Imshaugia aleurites]